MRNSRINEYGDYMKHTFPPPIWGNERNVYDAMRENLPQNQSATLCQITKFYKNFKQSCVVSALNGLLRKGYIAQSGADYTVV